MLRRTLLSCAAAGTTLDCGVQCKRLHNLATCRLAAVSLGWVHVVRFPNAWPRMLRRLGSEGWTWLLCETTCVVRSKQTYLACSERKEIAVGLIHILLGLIGPEQEVYLPWLGLCYVAASIMEPLKKRGRGGHDRCCRWCGQPDLAAGKPSYIVFSSSSEISVKKPVLSSRCAATSFCNVLMKTLKFHKAPQVMPVSFLSKASS